MNVQQNSRGLPASDEQREAEQASRDRAGAMVAVSLRAAEHLVKLYKAGALGDYPEAKAAAEQFDAFAALYVQGG